MNTKIFGLITLVMTLLLVLCSCGTTDITRTEVLPTTVTLPGITLTAIVPGPAATITQTTVITITGPTSTATETATATVNTTSIQTTTYTVTATIAGPTTTVATTKTGVVTQGIIFVSDVTPPSPVTLHFNDWVSITLDYVITSPGGAYIWAIPMTGGKITPNISYAGSMFPPGRGTINRGFTVTSGSIKVDEINLLMQDSNKTVTLFQAFVPVNYSFGP